MAMTLDGSNGVTFNDASLQGAAASPFGLKNRIINGDMVIDQRNAGASVTPVNGQFITDRFAYITTQSSKATSQQSSVAPTGFIKSLLFTSSSAYSAAAGDLIAFTQAIEGFNVADLGWGTANAKTVTLSFQVRSSLTGTFGGCFRNEAGNRFYVFSYVISAANTWETKTITIVGDTSGTWATDNTAGIRLYFNLGCGTTYSGTAGSWGTTAYYNVTGGVNLVGTNGATFYITGVQLERNTTATPFEWLPYGTELALCQRYYQKYTSIAAGDGICFGGYGFPQTSSVFRLPGSFPTPFRGTPTFSYSNLSVSTAGGTQSTVSSSAGMGANSTAYDLNLNVTVTTGTPYFLRATSGNNGYVDFSAEL